MRSMTRSISRSSLYLLTYYQKKILTPEDPLVLQGMELYGKLTIKVLQVLSSLAYLVHKCKR
jgi:hypothetical protein